MGGRSWMDADPNEAFERYSEFLVDFDSRSPYDDTAVEDNEEGTAMRTGQGDHGKARDLATSSATVTTAPVFDQFHLPQHDEIHPFGDWLRSHSEPALMTTIVPQQSVSQEALSAPECVPFVSTQVQEEMQAQIEAEGLFQDATSPLALRSSSLPSRVEASGESSSTPPTLPSIRPSRSSVSSPSGSKRSRVSLISWIKTSTTLKELESSGHTYSDLDTMSEADLKKLKRILEKRQAAKKQYQKNKKEKVELLRKADDYNALLANYESILADNQMLRKENDELKIMLRQQRRKQG